MLFIIIYNNNLHADDGVDEEDQSDEQSDIGQRLQTKYDRLNLISHKISYVHR